MKLNFRILLVTLMEKAVSIFQKMVQELLVLNRATQKLLKPFTRCMEGNFQKIKITRKIYIGEISSILGFSEKVPSMLSEVYTHFCVRKRSKLDCLLNTPPQRMLILKPNMLCKLKV